MRLLHLFFLFIISSFSCKLFAQTQLSIENMTVQVAPSYTITNGDAFIVTGSVKNVGTVTLGNTTPIHVHLAIDTSSTGTPKYYLRSTRTYTLANFSPSQTFTFSVNDNGDGANGYKIAGNGTTVVIWAVAGFPTNDSTSADSAFTNLYINQIPLGINAVDDLNNSFFSIENPARLGVNLECTSVYESFEVTMLNNMGEVVLSDVITSHNLILKTKYLKAGIYYLRFYNKRLNKTGTKKIIMQ